MKITFQLRFHTDFGQSLALAGKPPFPNLRESNPSAEFAKNDFRKAARRGHRDPPSSEENSFGFRPIPLTYRDTNSWEISLDIPASAVAAGLGDYEYGLIASDGSQTLDWGLGRSLPGELVAGAEEIFIADSWNNPGCPENAFYTEPFQRVLLADRQTDHGKRALKREHQTSWTHCFRVMAPLLEKGQTLCLLGGSPLLGNWSARSPILLRRPPGTPCFEATLDLAGERLPLEYKYGVFDVSQDKFVRFEDGPNRVLQAAAAGGRKTILNDGFARLPADGWRAAGMAIPVFSLRSRRSFGVGEFTDLELLADWAAKVGLRLIQILPVNDTSATFTWADSYPYAAISAFALHPVYLDLSRVAEAGTARDEGVSETKCETKLDAVEEDSPGEVEGGEEILACTTMPVESVDDSASSDKVKDAVDSHNLPVDDPPSLDELEPERQRLNSLPRLDYEAVLKVKLDFLRRLYPRQRPELFASLPYREFFQANRHWLVPYGVFCHLRDKYGTTDFSTWPEHSTWSDGAAALADDRSPVFDQVGFYFYLQFHLHRQLQFAAAHAHSRGVILKGDIPIGIHRFGVDAWQQPGLYHLDMQAGAPPDAFAVKGQNWGFPTYNWERMTQDGFSWWKQRFSQMSDYFDAFRIDHILGFFRIWSIPMESVEGIMGHFVPALPVDPMEFAERRIPADPERYLEPYITDDVLEKVFGPDLVPYARQFLNPAHEEETAMPAESLAPTSSVTGEPGGVGSASLAVRAGLSREPFRFALRPEFRTQRQIEDWFSRNAGLNLSLAEEAGGPLVDTRQSGGQNPTPSLPEDPVACGRLKEGLFDLASNVILLEIPPALCHPNLPSSFHFRLGMQDTLSFQALDPAVQNQLRELYIDYFFRRQDEFWRREALTKLPALKRVTNMLICGEDLGMVPATVPEVMHQLGLLSLEVQRMPKQLHRLFSHPPQAPYLSVVTPSTHDMSTIRGWWEEDGALIQRFWNEELGQPGQAPSTCTGHANRLVVRQHLRSPAMWAVFQLQDLLGIDEVLRRPEAHEERINVPAMSSHYWQYRMHLDLETLLAADGFNQDLEDLLRANGRA